MAYTFTLEEQEKRELLRIARATIREFLASGHIPPGSPHRKSLLAPAGVFVSLHKGDELRGCIGTLAETTPLYKAIQDMAIAAATRDPRYQSVRSEELTLLTIELSVLGARSRVRAPEEITVGTHGVCVSAAGRRGLLLPQVAVENDWTSLVFLERACEKAGLRPDTWRDPASVIEVFPAQVFSELTHPPLPGGR